MPLSGTQKVRTIARLVVALGCLLLPLPLSAAPATSVDANSQATIPIGAERLTAAKELVSIIAPIEGSEIQISSFATDFVGKLMVSSPDLIAMEKGFPTIRADLKAAWLPILFRANRKLWPAYEAELSGLLASNLQADELHAASTFFRSPAGQRFVNKVRDKLTMSSSASELVSNISTNPDKPADVSASTVSRDRKAAAKATVSETSSEDIRAAFLFGISAAGRKLLALNPKRAELEAKWFNMSDPESEKEIEAATMRVFERYIKEASSIPAAK
jgi:hypothetical protein